jgi:nucleolar protein 4
MREPSRSTQKLTTPATNLCPQVTETELRDAFKDAAFVWDVLMPLSADKKSKGFAFVTFTCRADAELAIAKVNGTEVRA